MSATTISSPRRSAERRADPRRSAAPRLPRRLSGPVRGRTRVGAPPQPITTVGARALAVVRSLPDRSLIDRLVRGRAWIPVLGVLLAGIVAMQVEILKLGTSLGRAIERTNTLQTQNESLQASVATLADDQRIQRLASAMGMVMPSPSLVTFLSAHPQHQLGKALANLHAPDPTTFAAELAAQMATALLIAPPSNALAPNQAGGASAASASGSTAAGATSTAQATTSSTTSAATAGPVSGAGGTSSAGTSQTTTSTSGVGTTGTSTTAAASSGTGAGGAAGLPSTTTSSSGSSTGG